MTHWYIAFWEKIEYISVTCSTGNGIECVSDVGRVWRELIAVTLPILCIIHAY